MKIKIGDIIYTSFDPSLPYTVMAIGNELLIIKSDKHTWESSCRISDIYFNENDATIAGYEKFIKTLEHDIPACKESIQSLKQRLKYMETQLLKNQLKLNQLKLKAMEI